MRHWRNLSGFLILGATIWALVFWVAFLVAGMVTWAEDRLEGTPISLEADK